MSRVKFVLNSFLIFLSELKLNETEANERLYIEGYDCIFKLRNSEGGGSAIFVDNETEYLEINMENEKNDEIIGIKLKLKNSLTSIFQYYNPPSKKLNIELLARLEKEHPNHLLLGDLNARIRPFCVSYNPNGKKLENYLLQSKAAVLNKTGSPTSYWRSN